MRNRLKVEAMWLHDPQKQRKVSVGWFTLVSQEKKKINRLLMMWKKSQRNHPELNINPSVVPFWADLQYSTISRAILLACLTTIWTTEITPTVQSVPTLYLEGKVGQLIKCQHLILYFKNAHWCLGSLNRIKAAYVCCHMSHYIDRRMFKQISVFGTIWKCVQWKVHSLKYILRYLYFTFILYPSILVTATYLTLVYCATLIWQL